MTNAPPFAPEDVAERFSESLEDSANPAYAQVATVDERGLPQLRTVHLRLMPERSGFGFACHTRSPKWRELAAKPVLSGCWVDYKRLTQFRWEGRAQLIGPEAQDAGARALLDRMWPLMRPDVRKAYWLDHWQPHLMTDSRPAAPQQSAEAALPRDSAWSEFDVAQRCPAMGAVLCLPERWDIFEMDPQDYTRGRRTLHLRKKGLWIPQEVSLLHGAPRPPGGRH